MRVSNVPKKARRWGGGGLSSYPVGVATPYTLNVGTMKCSGASLSRDLECEAA